jgi:hypothetical protein
MRFARAWWWTCCLAAVAVSEIANSVWASNKGGDGGTSSTKSKSKGKNKSSYSSGSSSKVSSSNSGKNKGWSKKSSSSSSSGGGGGGGGGGSGGLVPLTEKGRRWRVYNSSLPKLWLVGASKCATSSLALALEAHPKIFNVRTCVRAAFFLLLCGTLLS